MDSKNNQPPKKPDGNQPKGRVWVLLLATVAIVLLISVIYTAISNSQYKQTKFTDFLNE